jgi:hypothetical protein
MQKSFAALVLWMTSACTSLPVPAPPVVVRNAQGEVRASTEADAQRVALLLEELAPKVRAMLGETRDERPRLFVLDELDERFGPACNTAGVILMGPDSRKDERFTLAHELVHWQASGAWKALPPVMQEGLADQVAIEVVPESGPSTAVEYVYKLSTGRRRDPILAMQVTAREFSDMPHDDDRSGLYAIGFVIASRIGIRELYALCLKSELEGHEQVPAYWLLARARLPSTDIGEWNLVVQGSIPPDPPWVMVRTRDEPPRIKAASKAAAR